MVPLSLVYISLTAPLQLLASTIATEIAQTIGISVFRDGNIIHLTQISLGVEEACSGLESLGALTVSRSVSENSEPRILSRFSLIDFSD
jgi:hypothetical protein